MTPHHSSHSELVNRARGRIIDIECNERAELVNTVCDIVDEIIVTGGELDVAGLRRVGASPGHWWVDRLIRTTEAVSVAGGTSKQVQDRIFLLRSNAAAIQLRPLFLSAKQKPRSSRAPREKERKLVRSLLSRQRAWRFVSDISYQISSGRSLPSTPEQAAPTQDVILHAKPYFTR